nr:MAG TPA: hypothetical protein [Caudoviricetes sp.]
MLSTSHSCFYWRTFHSFFLVFYIPFPEKLALLTWYY